MKIKIKLNKKLELSPVPLLWNDSTQETREEFIRISVKKFLEDNGDYIIKDTIKNNKKALCDIKIKNFNK